MVELGRAQAAHLLQVDDLVHRADEVQPVAAAQYRLRPHRRDGGVTAVHRGEEQPRQVAQPRLLDGPSVDRATGRHDHLHAEAATLVLHLGPGRPSAGQDARGEDHDQHQAHRGDRQAEQPDLEEPDLAQTQARHLS